MPTFLLTHHLAMIPCPYCGGTALQAIGHLGRGFVVQCLTCKAQGPEQSSFNEALRAWNNRVSLASKTSSSKGVNL